MRSDGCVTIGNRIEHAYGIRFIASLRDAIWIKPPQRNGLVRRGSQRTPGGAGAEYQRHDPSGHVLVDPREALRFDIQTGLLTDLAQRPSRMVS